MSNRLVVWWDRRITGCLYLGPDGDTQFAYDAAWLADATAPALSFWQCHEFRVRGGG